MLPFGRVEAYAFNPNLSYLGAVVQPTVWFVVYRFSTFFSMTVAILLKETRPSFISARLL